MISAHRREGDHSVQYLRCTNEMLETVGCEVTNPHKHAKGKSRLGYLEPPGASCFHMLFSILFQSLRLG